LPEEKVELLNIISQPLLVELHFEIFSVAILEHSFFNNYYDINPGGIRKVCHDSVHLLRMSAGDVLFSDGEVPSPGRMFFITGGSIQYQKIKGDSQNGRHGSILCEPVLWLDWTHCGTARARERTELLALDAEKFQSRGKFFPTNHVRTYAEEYVGRLNALPTEELSDLDTLQDDDMQYLMEQAFPESDTNFDSDDDADDSNDEDEDEKRKSKHVGFVDLVGKESGASSSSMGGSGKAKHNQEKKTGFMRFSLAVSGASSNKRASRASMARKSSRKSGQGGLAKRRCPKRVTRALCCISRREDFWDWAGDKWPFKAKVSGDADAVSEISAVPGAR